MYIEALSIENYKCFLKRQSFKFEPGFNLLLGANNAGKTAALEAIDLNPNLNAPHRSDRTIPKYGGYPPPDSKFEIILKTRLSELRYLVGQTTIMLPVLGGSSQNQISEAVRSRVNEFVNCDEHIMLRVNYGHGTEILEFKGSDGIISGQVNKKRNANLFVLRLDSSTPTSEPQINIMNIGGVESNIAVYYQNFKKRIYRFNARRQPGTECAAQSSPILDEEAKTLPYCINHLQSNNSHAHKRLCSWVNRVFPSVQWIQAPSNPSGIFQLYCLQQPPEDQRNDLATPLSDMGTGIGNIIAMLYVVLTSRDPQVIAIDEPNAFLHPRALRELLAILESEGKMHQYILTAHSPDVLTAVTNQSISLLESDGVATTVTQIDRKNLHTLRSELANLGIHITDLHAKDRVLWVEGQTEELVMPELLRWACQEIAAGTAVLRVEHTGTFAAKKNKLSEVAEIYKRLSASSAMVPPMVYILLDAEKRGLSERQEITESSHGTLQFLDRRMFENYLIHPESVAAALQELGLEITSNIVNDALCKTLGVSDLLSCDLVEIDGAAVLKAVFSELSNSTLEFQKTRDIPVIVSYILENQPEYLEPLRTFLRTSFNLQ